MSWKLERLAIGIRTVKTFEMADKMGLMVDKLIPLQGTGPFPENCFTQYAKGRDYGVQLKDKNGTQLVTLNVDGVLVDCDMTAEPVIKDEIVRDMFKETLENTVMLTEAKNKVDRIGVVQIYTLKVDENSAKKIFHDTLQLDLSGVSDNIKITFALKRAAEDSIYFPGQIKDFHNTIVEISSRGDDDNKFPDTIQVSIDYQAYFKPEYTMEDVKIDEHFDKAKKVAIELLNEKLKYITTAAV
jgi:hypothetical protein